MRKIYVASSWRNPYQPFIVDILRRLHHEVYDFRNPPGATGFSWRQIDPNWEDWTPEQWRAGLQTQVARDGFRSDWTAMEWADTCLLVLPSGRSAHLEAGYMAGRGKTVFLYCPEKQEPELMVWMFGNPQRKILVNERELLDAFSTP